MISTRPDYVAAWLGISRVGGIVALMNTKLVGQSLAYCINVAAANHIIIESELRPRLEAVSSSLTGAAKVWNAGGGDKLDDNLAGFGDGPLMSAERRDVTISDCALLIFTSGTTGLPKAAKVSHRRVLSWAGWFAGLMGASARRPPVRLSPAFSFGRWHCRSVQYDICRCIRGSGRRILGK